MEKRATAPAVPDDALYDPDCRACPRLARFLDTVRAAHPDYHARPVASFGPLDAGLLIVGLAPGMHGANRTGRLFTGDHAGILLYSTLHKFGLANHAGSADPHDGLRLIGCRIVNSVKCVPPANKPEPDEIRRCNRYLIAELAAVKPRAILALGRIAHDAVVRAAGARRRDYVFAHGAQHRLRGPRIEAQLFDSFHCSRYNTQTGRLTAEMFEAVVGAAVRFVRTDGACRD